MFNKHCCCLGCCMLNVGVLCGWVVQFQVKTVGDCLNDTVAGCSILAFNGV